jgi:hypothetical protein
MSLNIGLLRGVCVSTCVVTEVFQPFNTLKPYVRWLYYENLLQMNDAIMHVAQFSICPAFVKHCSRVSLRLLARRPPDAEAEKQRGPYGPKTDLGDPRVTIDRIQQIL